ncbi:MAG: DUF2956 family protein [Oceanicoccus sp.]
MTNRSRAEKKVNKSKLSTEAEAKVQVITNRVVPVSFTKQQRKEVQQAIENGMATLRNQTKSNNRDRDKKVKKLQTQLEIQSHLVTDTDNQKVGKAVPNVVIPWSLLVLSWLFFAAYIVNAEGILR